MNEHEEKTVAAFIIKEKRHRYRYLLDNNRECSKGLDRLNHCDDLDPRFIQWLGKGFDIISLLRKEGCPDQVYLISAESELDKQTLSLEQAIERTRNCG